MNHERLIKRSTIIEGRLAGNLFCTVAINKDENLIGCGCGQAYLKQAGCVALSAGVTDIFAISNNGTVIYRSLVPYDYEANLIPHYAFDTVVSKYGAKHVSRSGMVVAASYRSGSVSVGGYPEANEDDAIMWSDIDDIICFSDGIAGLTKSGTVLLCGNGAVPYLEMTNWTNIARLKAIPSYLGCFAVSGFVGLKKDGTLLYCGKDHEFGSHISRYKDVVSFDGCFLGEKVKEFYAVKSDGSVYMYMYFHENDVVPTIDTDQYKKDCIAVKYLPSGPHFIKKDGTLETVPLKMNFPDHIQEALVIQTGRKYDVVQQALKNAAEHPLAEQVTGWKLFNDPDEVLRRYEGFEDGSFERNGKCLYCGGTLKGFFTKKCTVCGKSKDFF